MIRDDLYGAQAVVFSSEIIAQFVQIQADVVNGLILGEDGTVAIENFSAHSRDANSAKGLPFEMGLIVARGNDLDPPQPDHQYSEARGHSQPHPAEVGIVLIELAK